MDWQPIESAPDGRRFLVWGAYEDKPTAFEVHIVGHVFDDSSGMEGRFLVFDGPDYVAAYATHWMPLPEPPQ